MKINTLYLALGLAGLMSVATSANAALTFQVDIVAVDDNGNIVTGTAGSKAWDLSTQQWTQTTTDGHILNDLVNTLTWRNGGTSLANSASVVVGNLTYDVDPTLSFDATFTNNTAFNQTYTVSYNTPLVPNLSGVINSSANLTAQLTDVNGNGAKITPANGNGNIMRSWDLTVDQNQISKNVDIGSQYAIASGFGSNSWSAANTLLCGTGAAACETMSTVLTFTLSKGDKVRLFGDLAQVAAVPAPAAIWLFGSALAGFIGMRRKGQAA